MGINDRSIDLTRGEKFRDVGRVLSFLTESIFPWHKHRMITSDDLLTASKRSYDDVVSEEAGCTIRRTSTGRITRIFQEYNDIDDAVTRDLVGEMTGATVDFTCNVCPLCGRINFERYGVWSSCSCYEDNKKYSNCFVKLFHRNQGNLGRLIPERYVPWMDYMLDFRNNIMGTLNILKSS